jgi:hypothetical protein
MNRKDIIKRLVKEGMTEKTLANFSDKQINALASRMLNEATQSVVKKLFTHHQKLIPINKRDRVLVLKTAQYHYSQMVVWLLRLVKDKQK